VPELLDGDVERLGVEREAGELLHHSSMWPRVAGRPCSR
jgi:hypothetical protein